MNLLPGCLSRFLMWINNNKNCNVDCEECKYQPLCDLFANYSDYDNLPEQFEKADDALKLWADEHPIKTRLDVFKELFPDYEFDSYGFPAVCVRSIDVNMDCLRIKGDSDCKKCKSNYWNEVVV